mgnify:FL=1
MCRPIRIAWKRAIPAEYQEESALMEDVSGGQNVYKRKACTVYTLQTFKTGSSSSEGAYLVIGAMESSASADLSLGDSSKYIRRAFSRGTVLELKVRNAVAISVQKRIGQSL